MNVLFVCSMGWLRSRTAAQVFGSEKVETMHCGTDEDAVTPLRDWFVTQYPDVIICMEQAHKHAVIAAHPEVKAPIHVLGITDEYNYMAPELVALLRARVPPLLGIA